MHLHVVDAASPLPDAAVTGVYPQNEISYPTVRSGCETDILAASESRVAFWSYPPDGPWTVFVNIGRFGQTSLSSPKRTIEVSKTAGHEPVIWHENAGTRPPTTKETNMHAHAQNATIHPVASSNADADILAAAQSRVKFWNYLPEGPWTVPVVVGKRTLSVSKVFGQDPVIRR